MRIITPNDSQELIANLEADGWQQVNQKTLTRSSNTRLGLRASIVPHFRKGLPFGTLKGIKEHPGTWFKIGDGHIKPEVLSSFSLSWKKYHNSMLCVTGQDWNYKEKNNYSTVPCSSRTKLKELSQCTRGNFIFSV